jgi:hypothetical protein
MRAVLGLLAPCRRRTLVVVDSRSRISARLMAAALAMSVGPQA